MKHDYDYILEILDNIWTGKNDNDDVLYKREFEALQDYIDTTHAEINCLKPRLEHLLKSKTIRSFDEVNPKTKSYKLDINDLDEIIQHCQDIMIQEYELKAVTGYFIEDLLIAAKQGIPISIGKSPKGIFSIKKKG